MAIEEPLDESLDDSLGNSLGSWLDARLCTVSEDLATRIRAVIPEQARSVRSSAGGDALAVAAATALRNLVINGCETRAAAPDLLVIDALVTYACEIAASNAADVEASADLVLREILRVPSGRDSTGSASSSSTA